MILKLFSVQDTKVGAYMPPFSARAKGEAVRSFASACQDEKHQFFQHKADYILWQIGEFDDSSGAMRSDIERIIGGDEF